MNNFRRLLVPLDGSDIAEEALAMATELAVKFESEIVLLRVLDIPGLSMPSPYPEERWTQEALQYSHREAQLYLEARQRRLEKRGIRVKLIVREESPAEEILLVARSEQVDLVIMTSHGMGGPSPWPAGSVAAKVVQLSPCPVLLVRQDMVQQLHEQMAAPFVSAVAAPHVVPKAA